MVAQKGKNLLLKLDTNGAGNFVTVAGMRSKRIAFNVFLRRRPSGLIC